VNADIRAFKVDLTAIGEATCDEIFHDLVLSVYGYAFSIGEIEEGNSMTLPVKANLDAVVEHPFAIHASADSGASQQIHSSLLQHAGANPVFAVIPRAKLNNDRVNAAKMEQMR
jgi:hypothetical protein